MKFITVINKKGGVGKTTSTVNIADQLAKQGQSVLIIDADEQGNSSSQVSSKDADFDVTIAELMDSPKTVSIFDCIYETTLDDVYLIPSDIRLKETKERLIAKRNRTTILKKIIAQLNGDEFDFVIIDCPPSSSVISENAIMIADMFLVPLDECHWSQTGFADLQCEIADVLEVEFNQLPPMIAYLTKVNKAKNAYKEIAKELGDEIPEIFKPLLNVRTSAEVDKAIKVSQTMSQFNPNHLINNDYKRIAKYLITNFS